MSYIPVARGISNIPLDNNLCYLYVVKKTLLTRAHLSVLEDRSLHELDYIFDEIISLAS
jgi:hypothetical protein